MDQRLFGNPPECLYQGKHEILLRGAYKNHCSDVTVADFLVIAAEMVMVSSRDVGLEENPSKPEIDFTKGFKLGRQTALECPGSAHQLPNPENVCAANEEPFVQNMELSWPETAALIGVHTLGRAQPQFLAYLAYWSDPENQRRFSSTYYTLMVFKRWEANQKLFGNPGKNQWVLDTDLCLAFEPSILAASADCCAWW